MPILNDTPRVLRHWVFHLVCQTFHIVATFLNNSGLDSNCMLYRDILSGCLFLCYKIRLRSVILCEATNLLRRAVSLFVWFVSQLYRFSCNFIIFSHRRVVFLPKTVTAVHIHTKNHLILRVAFCSSYPQNLPFSWTKRPPVPDERLMSGGHKQAYKTICLGWDTYCPVLNLLILNSNRPCDSHERQGLYNIK